MVTKLGEESKMKNAITILIWAVLALSVPAGCTKEEAKKPSDKISVQLKWLHQAQFAGFYAADQKGFYTEENIEVTLRPGGVDIDEIEMVNSGRNDFGIVSAPLIIAKRAEGVAIKAIAVILRRDPTVYFTLKGSGIRRPTDFVGRKVIVFPNDFALPAMLSKRDLRMDQLVAVPPSFEMEPFFTGDVDVWTGYLTNQVLTARQKGHKLNLIFPDDYGIHTYSDVIITSDRMIKENPDQVERFLRATLQGWKWAIENPKEAGVLALKYDPKKDAKRQIAEMEASVPLIHTGEDNIGWMKKEIWQGMHDLLLNQDIIVKSVDMGNVYTMEFLKKIYRSEK